MQNYFLQLIFFVSLGIVVYIVASAIPRVAEERKQNIDLTEPEPHTEKINAGMMLEKIDKKISLVKDKILRRMKVIVMKFDNHLSERLHKNDETGVFKK